jgi:hypothetical protein
MKKRRKLADADETDPQMIEDAVNETPASDIPPEVDETTAELTSWDEAPAVPAAPTIEPEDEVTVAELLVEEGMEEADRDRRIAAADPDFEP